MNETEILAHQGLKRREREQTKKDVRKAKKTEVPWKMRKHSPTNLHHGHIFQFYQPLQSFSKMVGSLNMDSCKFSALTMLHPLNMQVWFLFSALVSFHSKKSLLSYSVWQHMHFSFWLMCRICIWLAHKNTCTTTEELWLSTHLTFMKAFNLCLPANTDFLT